MSLQEVFDKAVFGLKAQNYKKSINPATGKCRYRFLDHDELLKCPAGHLIDDCDYKSEFEDKITYYEGLDHASQANVCSKFFASRYSREECILIDSLQQVHDSSENKDWLISGLKDLANRYGLSFVE